jgi:hypothetical protein
MSDPVQLSELTFIPQPVRNKLRRHGFGTSADLLRTRTVRLARRLGGAVTIADITRWQIVCSTLEIEGMTLPWARVLGEQGNIAARDLARRKLSKIIDLFAQARQRGDVANVPDADVVAAMMVDSARIDTGGVLNATIWDRNDRPIRGARVRCTGVEATTDAKGRARLLRLPLGQPVEVTIDKTGYAPLRSKLPSLAGPNVPEAYRFSLKRGRASTKPSKRMLSEFDGDVISVRNGQRVQLVEVKNRRVRERDILHLFERLRNGEVKLSSRYKELRDGQLTIPVWQLPSTALPQGAAVGSDYRVTSGVLQPVEVTARRLARWRIARQVASETKRSGSIKARLKIAFKECLKRARAIGAFG